jgi:uncharacterized protein YoxC
MTTQDLAMVVIAISAAVVAVAFVLIAVSVYGLSHDARELGQRSDALIAALERELPPTIAQARELSASAAQLASAAQPRLDRLDSLADEAEATLIAVREVAATLNGLVRGPADTVSGVKRSVRVVGEGVASGANRIRRAIAREGEEDDARG